MKHDESVHFTPAADVPHGLGSFPVPASEAPPAHPPAKDGPTKVDGAKLAERAVAMQRDAAHGEAFQLSELWKRLGEGEWRVRDTFSTPERLYAVVEPAPRARRRPRSRQGLAMMEQVMLGQSAKSVAIERRVSQSTVALATKVHRERMGLACKTRAVPLIFVMAARAAMSTACKAVLGQIAAMPAETGDAWVVSVRCPSFGLFDQLTSAERVVLVELLAGKSYAEISRSRATSQRTVANQIASGFRKLGVSGHGETLHFVMTRVLSVNHAE